MKTHDQIEQAFIEAVGQPEKATAETVTQACEAVLSKATDQFGSGVYVSGKLNADMQGISFRYKRPAIRQRLEFFVPCPVDKPARKEDVDDTKKTSQKASKKSKREDNAGNDDAGSTGSPQDEGDSDRLMILEAAALNLGDDDFMGDGRPHVDKINDHLEEGVDPFTAAERDELWAQRSGE